MSRLPIHDLESAPEESTPGLVKVQEKFGKMAEAGAHVGANVFTNYFNHYSKTQLGKLKPAPGIGASVPS